MSFWLFNAYNILINIDSVLCGGGSKFYINLSALIWDTAVCWVGNKINLKSDDLRYNALGQLSHQPSASDSPSIILIDWK